MPDPAGLRAQRTPVHTSTTAELTAPRASAAQTRPEPSASEHADRAADGVLDARARVRARPRDRTSRIPSRALMNSQGREDLPKADQPGDIAVNVRSFLPQQSVGGGFSADARGFSVSEDGRSRIHSRVVVHEGEQGFSDQIEEGAYSDRTFHPYLGKGPIINQAEPSIDAHVTASDETGVALQMQYSAADPLTPPGTPDVDVRTAVSVRRTSPEHVQVDFRVMGDGFPAAEAFVTDHEGNAVFLGTHAIDEGQTVFELYGGATEVMIEGSVTVLTSPEGTFRGVEQDGHKYTLEEWNARFEAQPALRP